jgi:hypothetical protein
MKATMKKRCAIAAREAAKEMTEKLNRSGGMIGI